MRKFLKKIVVHLLTEDAKRLLKKHKPKIIAITGNVGKTGTKDAISQIALPEARASKDSFNSDIGVPLTILGLQNEWRNPLGWLKNLVVGEYRSHFLKEYEDTLILEVGADAPKDIEKISRWLKPNILCITTIPPIPVHIEAFGTREKVLEEKGSLINSLKEKGVLILNADDGNDKFFINKAKNKGKRGAKIIKVGFNENSFIYAKDIRSIITEENAYTYADIYHLDRHMRVRLKNIVGEQTIYPLLYAIAVGMYSGKSFEELIGNAKKYKPPKGRARFFRGKKGSKIIDDTYNSSPSALKKMIDFIKQTEGRKILALGDMKELGDFSENAHKKVGEEIAGFADFFIAVGPEMKHASEKAIECGMKNVLHFEKSEQASIVVRQILKKGDVILVKGSQSTRMEKIMEKILENERDKKFLVRQSEEWKKR